MKKINKKAFTLIELLVVVLIIGILAAIAVPQYQVAVEKSIMQEAIINLKAIAQAQDAFYLQNGRYANMYEINKLDISIPGKITTGDFPNRIETDNFVYSPNGYNVSYKGVAQRMPFNTIYFLYTDQNDKVHCYNINGSSAQQKLCNQINQEGHL